jgi:hypothetical protein
MTKTILKRQWWCGLMIFGLVGVVVTMGGCARVERIIFGTPEFRAEKEREKQEMRYFFENQSRLKNGLPIIPIYDHCLYKSSCEITCENAARQIAAEEYRECVDLRGTKLNCENAVELDSEDCLGGHSGWAPEAIQILEARDDMPLCVVECETRPVDPDSAEGRVRALQQ